MLCILGKGEESLYPWRNPLGSSCWNGQWSGSNPKRNNGGRTARNG